MFERLYASSQVFQANIHFLSQFRLEDAFRHLLQRYAEENKKMADFQADETRLEADVQTETNLVTQVQAATQSNQAQIKTMTDEITTLRDQGADTTAMEAALATLENNNQTLTGLVPAPASPASDAGQATGQQGGTGQAT